MKATVIVSPLDHPYLNLSLEEYFMKYDVLDEPILFFYVNRPSVILGRNQNPWLECDLLSMKKEGVVLARRMTGGGTVYHDYGNLNYSFIYKHHQISENNIFDFLIQGLSHLGFHVHVGKRKELILGDLKISGTAFGRYRDRVVHHGTLLVDANLFHLEKYLKPNGAITSTKSVLSVPSPVVNLKDIRPDIHLESIIEQFVSLIQVGDEDDGHRIYAIMENETYKTIQNKHQSWRWLFGETPPFEVANPLNFEELLRVYKGQVTYKSEEVFAEMIKTMPYIHSSVLHNA